MILLALSHFRTETRYPLFLKMLLLALSASEEDQMRSYARLALLALLLLAAGGAQATDQGQFENIPDNIRSWFKSVKSPKGVPCCDISDGHRTDYDMRDGSYWVPIEGEWRQVPQGAV